METNIIVTMRINFTLDERRAIYTEAARIFESIIKDPYKNDYMCCEVYTAGKNCGLIHNSDEWHMDAVVTPENFPELFMFKEIDRYAWMTNQLIFAGVDKLSERKRIKYVALLLCVEMCK